MSKLRLLFIKEGPAAYISHLDLLRTVQRAFPRTELEIKHSNGYHPHPIISIVLPLPVGQSSRCELLDFEVTQDTDGRGIAEKLNEGMPEGLRVLECYEAKRPVRELAALQAKVTFEYDGGVPENAAGRLQELLSRRELIIQKRTKRKDLADVGGEVRPGGHRRGPGTKPGAEPPAAGKGCGAVCPGADTGLYPGPPSGAAGCGGKNFPVKTKKILAS